MSQGHRIELGPAYGTEIIERGEQWTLAMVRDFAQPPEVVWEALTDPQHLKEWAPFEASGNLGVEGARVVLSTVGAPKDLDYETTVRVARRPTRLEFGWGENDVKWELEPRGSGTRLLLWARIARDYVAMGAAGWHVCLAVLDRALSGSPVGRIVGQDALKFSDWKRLYHEYGVHFGVIAGEPGGQK